jgi:hypothetical protein
MVVGHETWPAWSQFVVFAYILPLRTFRVPEPYPAVPSPTGNLIHPCISNSSPIATMRPLDLIFHILCLLSLAMRGVLGAGCSGVNQATTKLIESFEGFVPSPKPDPVGLPTVGFGHQCKTKGCSEVPFKFPLTEATAEALLAQDIRVSTHQLLDDKTPPRHHVSSSLYLILDLTLGIH